LAAKSTIIETFELQTITQIQQTKRNQLTKITNFNF